MERRKKPKTLSGIETGSAGVIGDCTKAGKNLKPYQGLKRVVLPLNAINAFRRKKPKTLSGIETRMLLAYPTYFSSRKKPKTLSGIETDCPLHNARKPAQAGKNLKPYQGLKLWKLIFPLLPQIAGKNLKPYQGLKRGIISISSFISLPEKT